MPRRKSLSSLSSLVPPVEVSRLLLLALVAAGGLVSVAATGVISSFAGGFAAGAGSVFVVSFLRNPRRASGEGEP